MVGVEKQGGKEEVQEDVSGGNGAYWILSPSLSYFFLFSASHKSCNSLLVSSEEGPTEFNVSHSQVYLHSIWSPRLQLSRHLLRS